MKIKLKNQIKKNSNGTKIKLENKLKDQMYNLVFFL